jgi:hypothetical protein
MTTPRKKRRSRSSTPKKPPGRVVVIAEGEDMSNRTRRDLKVLKETIAQHTQTVERRLNKVGSAPRALVASAAKYYPTLKKLAEK